MATKIPKCEPQEIAINMGKGWISDYNSEPEKFGFAYYCTDKKIR
jgi:hypothetical protein